MDPKLACADSSEHTCWDFSHGPQASESSGEPRKASVTEQHKNTLQLGTLCIRDSGASGVKINVMGCCYVLACLPLVAHTHTSCSYLLLKSSCYCQQQHLRRSRDCSQNSPAPCIFTLLSAHHGPRLNGFLP